MVAFYLFLLTGIAALGFVLGHGRASAFAAPGAARLHSRPVYHGAFVAIAAAVPALLSLLVWAAVAPRVYAGFVADRYEQTLSGATGLERETFFRQLKDVAAGRFAGTPTGELAAAAGTYRDAVTTGNVVLGLILAALAIAGLVWALRTLTPQHRARHFVERFVMAVLMACSVVAVLTTVGIILSLVFESIRFFEQVPVLDFLFGTHWSPQSAFVGAGGETGANAEVFGAVPLFAGTLLITAIAMLVAAPVGLMSAIYLSDYAKPRFRAVAKPVLEILAGIPTVVYGFFAALTVAPFIRRTGEAIGLNVASESALAAGLVMGIMIIPFVSSLSDDVINAVPQSLRDGSAAMGATKSETIRRVVLPAALPGVVSAMLLAVSRAVGETMIVVMAAGLGANLTANPLEAVTTVTVQIVTLLVGDQEFDSPKTLAAFALGLVLFCITLMLNIVALRVVKRYREQYD